MAWYNKLGEIGLGAAKGYGAASHGGLAGGLMGAAEPIAKIVKKKKRNNLTGMGKTQMGADPGGETVDLAEWRPGMVEEEEDVFLR
jgi:hypothetical protein